MNLNRATIIGNLTRDPETKTLTSGQSVVNFSVATNLVWKDSQTGEDKKVTEFHNIVAWRKLGEICAQYLKKGSKVYIEGRLQTRSWDDQGGAKHYRTEIVAENMIMLDRPTTGAGSNNSSSNNTANNSYNNNQSNFSQSNNQQADSMEEIQIEQIPF